MTDNNDIVKKFDEKKVDTEIGKNLKRVNLKKKLKELKNAEKFKINKKVIAEPIVDLKQVTESDNGGKTTLIAGKESEKDVKIENIPKINTLDDVTNQYKITLPENSVLKRFKSIGKRISNTNVNVIESRKSENELGARVRRGMSELVKPELVANKILNLALKLEWAAVDLLLRNKEHGTVDILAVDSETGMNMLMLAAKDNKLIIIERLIELGIPINDMDKMENTALHYAAKHAKEDVVRLLMNKRANVKALNNQNRYPIHEVCTRSFGVLSIAFILLKNMPLDLLVEVDVNGCTPLYLAAESKNVSVCKELLQYKPQKQVEIIESNCLNSVFHVAAEHSDVELMKLFVGTRANVNLQNIDGQTCLHVAAHYGNISIIKLLHAANIDPNIVDTQDRSALHIAAEEGQTKIIGELVDKLKANVMARTKDGSTLMHVASVFGHPETALVFMTKGVPLHMPNMYGSLSLHSAATSGHTTVVKMLLNKGSHPDALTKNNFTALHLAVQNQKPLVVEMLLGYGAKVEIKGGNEKETPLHISARIIDGKECTEMLLKSGANVNSSKDNGETPLHVACKEGNVEVIKMLLNEGANPFLQSKCGETSVHIAVRHCHLQVLRILIDHVAVKKMQVDVTNLISMINNEGETALHYAAELKSCHVHVDLEDTDIIRLLNEYKSNIGAKTNLTLETPLHYCARCGNEDICLEIIKSIKKSELQLELNKQAKNGWSALLYASEQGHHGIVKLLIDYQARVDVFDEHGKAALHLASENGHEKVVKILLENKAFVNAKSKLGITPLHLAAYNGCNNLVTILIKQYNALIDCLTLAKKTPLHLAAANGMVEVCKNLKNMNANIRAVDISMKTALHIACENDHAKVVKLFLRKSNDDSLITMADEGGMTAAHLAAEKGSISVIKELINFNKNIVTSIRNKKDGSMVLHLAAAKGHKTVVNALLNAGTNPIDEDNDSMTPLHLAAKCGHVHILRVFKGSVDFEISGTKTGFSALHVAASFGQIDFVREMLLTVSPTASTQLPAGGLSANEDDYGYTSLHLAAKYGHEGLVRLLLNHSAVKVDTTTAINLYTPFHLATRAGNASVVSLLLSRSVNLMNIKDKKGRTGLHHAASHGHQDMILLLLGQGADIDMCDKFGWTMMHYACKFGHLHIVKQLSETGASLNLETNDGNTAVSCAAEYGQAQILSYILKQNVDIEHLISDSKLSFNLMLMGKLNNQRSIEEFVLSANVPIECAIHLSQKYRTLAIQEKERSNDIMLAATFCENLAVELNSIATSQNVASELLTSVDKHGIQLIDMYILNEQKMVVAHPSIQKYISEIWVGHLIDWPSWKFMLLFLFQIIFPPLWFLFAIPSKHKLKRVPIIKFMSYLVSHINLIIIYIFTVVYPLNPIATMTSIFPSWIEWLLLAWVSGLLVSELTNPGSRSGLGWIKVFVIITSTIAVDIHVAAIFIDPINHREFIYIRNQFFALSLLLCCLQLLDFLIFHYLFGPWAIIIRDLMKDLIRFMVILFLFIFGFVLNVTCIYQPVDPPLKNDTFLGTGDGSGGSVEMNFTKVLEMFFFSLFGLIEPENLPPLHRNPSWATTLTKLMFGLYLIVTLIVLVNLLIALLSDTYQRIQAQSDIEWKFGRAKLFRNLTKTAATPSPWNLLTKLYVYIRIILKYRSASCITNIQAYIDEFEDIQEYSTELGASGSNWSSNKITPNTKEKQKKVYVKTKDIIDWKDISLQYLILNGRSDEEL